RRSPGSSRTSLAGRRWAKLRGASRSSATHGTTSRAACTRSTSGSSRREVAAERLGADRDRGARGGRRRRAAVVARARVARRRRRLHGGGVVLGGCGRRGQAAV